MQAIKDFLAKYDMAYGVRTIPAMRDRNGTAEAVPNQFLIVRDDTGDVIAPKTVSSRYRTISPTESSERIAPYVAEGWITPDRGFLFDDGSYEVQSYRIDGGSLEDHGKVGGESWDHFLSLHNWHGGGGTMRGSIHSHRIVCENTARKAAGMADFAIRHTASLSIKLDEAVQEWTKLREEIRKISDRYTVWNSVAVSSKEADSILRGLYGIKAGETEEDVSGKTWNEFEFAVSQFSNPRRGTFGKSLADVYNAVTATNSHYTPESRKDKISEAYEARRMASILDPNGSRSRFEGEAVAILDRLAGIAG